MRIVGSRGAWRLRVEMTTLGPAETPVDATVDQPEVFGVVDADGNGFADPFVLVDRGASTSVYTPYRLSDTAIRAFTIDGKPYDAPDLRAAIDAALAAKK